MSGYAPICKVVKPSNPLATELSVERTTADRFPSAPWRGLLFPTNTRPTFWPHDDADSEYVTVTSIDQDTITLERSSHPIAIYGNHNIAVLDLVPIGDVGTLIRFEGVFETKNTPYTLILERPDGSVETFVGEDDDVFSTHLEMVADESGFWKGQWVGVDGTRLREDVFFIRFI